MGYKGRDVEVVLIDDRKCMVMACDSCGAVGQKEFDIVAVSPYIVGRLTCRVALMEVISAGAVPKMLSNAICNEQFPTGEEMLKGIRDEMDSIALGELPMAISTEKNFETKQTALGITVIGVCNKESIRIGTSKPGDLVYCVGLPKVGNEINGFNDPDIAQAIHIIELLKINGIRDIIPIGSQGILREMEIMARNNNLEFHCTPQIYIDINKSAGPSTCIIFTCSKDSKLPTFKSAPITEIGELR